MISAHRNAVAVKNARLAEGHEHGDHRVPARQEVVVELCVPYGRTMNHRERSWILVFFLVCLKHKLIDGNMRCTTSVQRGTKSTDLTGLYMFIYKLW